MLTSIGRTHRHIPEIRHYGQCEPNLMVTVGPWPQGMVVQAHIAQPAHEVRKLFALAYADSADVILLPEGTQNLSPIPLVGTSKVHLLAEHHGSCTLIAAAYDNLGKGAAGAAVDNIKRMLG